MNIVKPMRKMVVTEITNKIPHDASPKIKRCAYGLLVYSIALTASIFAGCSTNPTIHVARKGTYYGEADGVPPSSRMKPGATLRITPLEDTRYTVQTNGEISIKLHCDVLDPSFTNRTVAAYCGLFNGKYATQVSTGVGYLKHTDNGYELVATLSSQMIVSNSSPPKVWRSSPVSGVCSVRTSFDDYHAARERLGFIYLASKDKGIDPFTAKIRLISGMPLLSNILTVRFEQSSQER